MARIEKSIEINRSPDEMATAMEPVFEEGIQSLKAQLEQP